jgi:signal transduction histidine kinase
MTQDSLLPSMFASPERDSPDELNRQAEQITALPVDLLNAIPDICLVLNRHRQIVFANRTLVDALGLPAADALIGRRPGEVLNCVHADEMAGCGTTEFCRTCGAARAILSSLGGVQSTEECHIMQTDGTALDLRVSGTPYQLDGRRFSVFVVQDISHENRRRVFERLFFHDVLNISGVLLGYSHQLLDMPGDDPYFETTKTMLYQATLRLIDEVKHQRELSAAESGDYHVYRVPIHARDLLDNVRDFYQLHEVAQERLIVIDPAAENGTFTSDPVLIERVLGNLVKNALEASQPGQTVTLSCSTTDERVAFTVHNAGTMPRAVQLQMFQRSFSTKGKGRGVGSYSVKLFTERYLRGTVAFTTSREAGTTFTVSYPNELVNPARP